MANRHGDSFEIQTSSRYQVFEISRVNCITNRENVGYYRIIWLQLLSDNFNYKYFFLSILQLKLYRNHFQSTGAAAQNLTEPLRFLFRLRLSDLELGLRGACRNLTEQRTGCVQIRPSNYWQFVINTINQFVKLELPSGKLT